jgi:signal transduction histidine kinase
MFAETLRLGRVRDAGERDRALAIIDQEATRLTRLVENVLAFSRAERRALVLSPEPADLGPLVREVVSGFEPLAIAAGTRVEIALEETPRLRVDRDAVRQMLLNLLDNAIRHGGAERPVAVSVRRAGPAVELAVEDEGAGIPPEAREKVWERFVRLPSRDGMPVSGVGIGLSVVRELAMLHGGSVRIEDGSRGGARFVVRLPLDSEGVNAS